MTRRALAIGAIATLAVGSQPAALRAQAPPTGAELRAAIGRLGDFEYTVRVEASRVVRRATAEDAVPALLEAARRHKDSYVQFRAAVLSVGFGEDRVGAFFREALDATNDRVRAAAYDYAEHAPDPALVPRLLAALDRETSEFVRPALVRALAAHGADAAVRARLVRDIDRGESYFRGAVIEALGDYQAEYAVDALVRIAEAAGPLRDDALIALGKIGHTRALATVTTAQGQVSEDLQPVVSAAACLLGVDCAGQTRYIVETLRFGATTGGDQGRLRNAARAAAALAMTGQRAALDALFDVGADAVDPARAPIALALGTAALRRPDAVHDALAERADLESALLLLRDAFDMLDEDVAEERFYVRLRDTYYGAPEGTRERAVAASATRVLEF